jgi:heat shock protein HslJ
MRYVKTMVVLAVAVIIGSSLPALAQGDNNLDVPFALPATFQGLTACADCPGIRVTVTLNADGTYNLEREYLERPARSNETGKWSYDKVKTQLTLQPTGTGLPEFFAISINPTLQALDAQGKPIPSSANFTYAPWLTYADAPLPLEATPWRLVELDGKAVPADDPQAFATLQFDAVNKRVTGSGGCNRISAQYEVAGDKLHIGPLAATRMMCPQPTMGTETGFFTALGSVTSYKIDGNTLSLFSADGTVLAQLQEEK